MIYNEIVEDCFFRSRHVGVLDLNKPLTVHSSSTQKNQNIAKLDLYLQCTENMLISKARFKATGNPFVIAALEWLCRQIEGRNMVGLHLITYQVLVKELEIPHNQYPIALQVEGVYQEVLTLMNKKFEDYKS